MPKKMIERNHKASQTNGNKKLVIPKEESPEVYKEKRKYGRLVFN